jgi:hypothetical protein
MPLLARNKLVLLTVFYRSTLLLSVVSSATLAILKIFNIPDMLLMFGVFFLSGGTVITLLHKEGYKQHEYYFYYNKGIGKLPLILTCIIGNLLVGILVVTIALNAK